MEKHSRDGKKIIGRYLAIIPAFRNPLIRSVRNVRYESSVPVFSSPVAKENDTRSRVIITGEVLNETRLWPSDRCLVNYTGNLDTGDGYCTKDIMSSESRSTLSGVFFRIYMSITSRI